MNIISRSEAKRLGLDRYYTGKPCKHGHIAKRSTYFGHCLECKRATNKKWSSENPKKCRAKVKRWYAENREKHRETCKKWRESNHEKYLAKKKKWREANPGACRANWAKYKATKLQATPAWADQDAINFWYECCPAGCHVDHIIPLQSENVCGLHVENNLQWLPAEQNLSKSNRWAA